MLRGSEDRGQRAWDGILDRCRATWGPSLSTLQGRGECASFLYLSVEGARLQGLLPASPGNTEEGPGRNQGRLSGEGDS